MFVSSPAALIVLLALSSCGLARAQYYYGGYPYAGYGYNTWPSTYASYSSYYPSAYSAYYPAATYAVGAYPAYSVIGKRSAGPPPAAQKPTLMETLQGGRQEAE